MAIDRAATLRNAEKLLRQGKPDAAIAEYLRVVEDQPRDWNTANILGDLLRPRRADRQGGRSVHAHCRRSEPGRISPEGDRALQEGPEDQAGPRARAARRPATIAASQGLLLDARTFLNDAQRAPSCPRRRARPCRGPNPTGFARSHRLPGAIRRRARAHSDPGHTRAPSGSSRRWPRSSRARGGRQKRSRRCAKRPSSVRRTTRFVSGCWPCTWRRATTREHANVRRPSSSSKASRHGSTSLARRTRPSRPSERPPGSIPSDGELKAYMARTFVARGDFASAAEYLTVETAGDDSTLLLTVAEIQLRDGSWMKPWRSCAGCSKRIASTPRRCRAARVEHRRACTRDRLHCRRAGCGHGCRPIGLARRGRGVAGVRDPRSEPYSRPDASGRDLRRRRARSDAVQRAGDSSPMRTSPPGWRPKPGSSQKTSLRANRGSAPTSSDSAAPSC